MKISRYYRAFLRKKLNNDNRSKLNNENFTLLCNNCVGGGESFMNWENVLIHPQSISSFQQRTM